MALFVVIEDFTGPGNLHFLENAVLDDALFDLNGLQAAGLQVVPATAELLAAIAAGALASKAQIVENEEGAGGVGAFKSVSVVHTEVTIAAAAMTKTVSLGLSLPPRAVLLHVEVTLDIVAVGGGISGLSAETGPTTLAAAWGNNATFLLAGQPADLSTGSPGDVGAYGLVQPETASVGATAGEVKYTGSVNLNLVTAFQVTHKLVYYDAADIP